jgi:DNA repair protein RadA/Sms
LEFIEMLGSGLREVSNPSEILISHKDEELWYGHCLYSEGVHMIEIQSSVRQFTEHHSAAPLGYNAKRLNMILAVLKKRAVSV